MESKVLAVIAACVLAPVAFSQTTAAAAPTAPKKAFEVASVKPSAMDMMQLAQQAAAGKMPKIGANVDGARAEYTFLSLKELIVVAYKVKPYQITGPDWLGTQRWDIQAKMPDGSKKDDAPEMLQTLLADRFKLTLHRETKDHPILALVVAKGGSKLKAAPAEADADIDPDSPLKPNETQMDTPEGPVRMEMGKQPGSATINMGKRGTMTYHMTANQSLAIESNKVSMEGFAEMLTQFGTSIIGAGGGVPLPVFDQTGLKGNYQVSFEFSLKELMAMAQASGMVPAGALPGSDKPGTESASDPSNTSSMFTSVQALGLDLKKTKGPVEQLIIDHVEKTPIEN